MIKSELPIPIGVESSNGLDADLALERQADDLANKLLDFGAKDWSAQDEARRRDRARTPDRSGPSKLHAFAADPRSG